MKKLLLAGLLCAAPLFAQVPQITASSNPLSSNPVQEGQTTTITCAANCTGLTWQVNGITGGNSTVGTISGNDTSATYTAPATIQAHQNWGGCPGGPNDTIANTPIAGMPELANWRNDPFLNSAWYVFYSQATDSRKAHIGTNLAMDDTFGMSLANNSTPKVNVAGFIGIPWPQTPNRKRETGMYMANITDQHVNVVNTDTCQLWEDFADNVATYACGTNTCYTGSSAALLPPNSYVPSGGTDAGGNVISPDLLHLSEILAAVNDGVPIRHAVHIRVPQNVASYWTNTIWPAQGGTGYGNFKDVVGITITNGGSGYTNQTTFTFSGGLASGALAGEWDPVITGGVITGATWKLSGKGNSNGSVYLSAPTVVISDPGGGSGATATATIDFPYMPYGARMALDQTYLQQHAGANCTAGSNCLTGAGLAVATELADYGGLMMDTTCCQLFSFDASNDIATDPAIESQIKSQISRLGLQYWHFYDPTKLAQNPTTNHTVDCEDDWGGTLCHILQVLPDNLQGYIPPDASWVTATNASGQSASIDMLLQPATIGVPDAEIWMLAGDYSGSKGTGGGYQLKSWVHGSDVNPAVTWSLQSGAVGTITTGGIYTPPTTEASTGVQDIAICSLVANPSITAKVYINILPNSGNFSADTLRIDSGPTEADVVDGNGVHWTGDIGVYSGDRSDLNGGAWKWFKGVGASAGEEVIYQTGFYPQNDILYKFIVPNGNYKVRMMSGWDLQGSGNPALLSTTLWNHMPMMVIASDNGYDGTFGGTGGIKVFNWNMMKDAAYTYATNSNSDVIFGTKVVDNVMELGLMTDSPNPNGFSACPGAPHSSCLGTAEISGIDVEPDATSPHLSIGVTNGYPATNPTKFVTSDTTVTPGKKLVLYMQDWYTGLTDPTTGDIPVTWSIVSGPGTLTQSTITLTPGQEFPICTYTGPSTQPAADTGVIIKATSTADPSISATINLRIAGTGQGPASTPTFFK